MREILFKAKRVDNLEWTYGFLCKEEDRYYITEDTDKFYQIIPKTICQYTSLKDKNGVKIFENDIMQNKIGGKGVVKYSRYAEFLLDFIDDTSISGFNPWILRTYEVTENIFDEEVK